MNRTFFLFFAAMLLAWTSVLAGPPSTAEQALEAGDAAFEQLDFSAAARHYERAAWGFKASGRTARRLAALERQGNCLHFMGRFREAAAVYGKGLSIADKTGDDRHRAILLCGLGRARFRLGCGQEAESHLTDAMAAARAAGDRATEAMAMNDLGLVWAEAEWHADALSAFDGAARMFQSVGDRRGAVGALLNGARTRRDMGNGEAAVRQIRQAARLLDAMDEPLWKARFMLTLGALAQSLGNAPSPSIAPSDRLDSEALFMAAADIARKHNRPALLSEAVGSLGGLYEREGRLDEALAMTRQAILAAQAAGSADGMFRRQWQLGRLLKKTGQMDGAVLAYRAAVADMERVGGTNRPENGKCRPGFGEDFRRTTGPLFLEFADLLLKRSDGGQTPEAVQADLREARAVLEKRKIGELQEYFQDPCVVKRRLDATEIDALVSEGTAAAYPILLPDRIEILVSFSDGIQRFPVSVRPDRLVTYAHRFRDRAQTPTGRHQRYAGALYRWLIQPLEPILARRGIDTLIVAPDGALRGVPFAALWDGEQSLIEKYAVVVTPGLSLTDPRPFDRNAPRVLVGGLTESVDGFAALPAVDDELNEISAIFQSTVLRNDAFTAPNLKNALGRADFTVVHIASHGQMTADPEDAFLLTHGGRLTLNQLERLMGINQYRQDPVALLTLSACQTAVGDDRAALGLAGVAVKAGAGSALATLWSVNDEAAARLVVDFYRGLAHSDRTKAWALQQAQLNLMKDDQYRHPAYWAPFLLIGNWR